MEELVPLWLLACAPHPIPPPAVALAVSSGEETALLDVSAPREFRGLWVATVHNLDFPSRRGLSVEEGTAELLAIVEMARRHGFNALVFQVRPEGDALYASTIEPWSRFLTGDQGVDPGYDPLEILLREAHARGIEVHAWFNPFRAQAVNGAPTADNHVSRICSDALCSWGKVAWLDPGDPEVRTHTLAVIDDVVARYDIDGVHLDDYFYPYPDGGRVFPDDDSYAAYRTGGGVLDRDAWRRQNVDSLVQAIGEHVAALRPGCRYGISPFGIYRPDQPEGIRGMDQYVALHADPLLWHERGWVDYLAPQLYWSTTREAQRYDRLLTWWDARVSSDRPLLVGLDLTRVGTNEEWSLQELETQVTLSRQAPRTVGQIWFRTRPVLENQAGVADLLARLYASPAVPPPVPNAPPSAPPAVGGSGAEVSWSVADPDSVRAYAVYRITNEPTFDHFLPPGTTSATFDEGEWALSVVRRGSVESRAVRFRVPAGPPPTGG